MTKTINLQEILDEKHNPIFEKIQDYEKQRDELYKKENTNHTDFRALACHVLPEVNSYGESIQKELIELDEELHRSMEKEDINVIKGSTLLNFIDNRLNDFFKIPNILPGQEECTIDFRLPMNLAYEIVFLNNKYGLDLNKDQVIENCLENTIECLQTPEESVWKDSNIPYAGKFSARKSVKLIKPKQFIFSYQGCGQMGSMYREVNILNKKRMIYNIVEIALEAEYLFNKKPKFENFEKYTNFIQDYLCKTMNYDHLKIEINKFNMDKIRVNPFIKNLKKILSNLPQMSHSKIEKIFETIDEMRDDEEVWEKFQLYKLQTESWDLSTKRGGSNYPSLSDTLSIPPKRYLGGISINI